MVNRAKIGTWLVFVCFFLTIAANFIQPATGHAAAIGAVSLAEAQKGPYNFINRSTIEAHLGSQVIDFVDTNPFDTNLNYAAQDYTCDGSIQLHTSAADKTFQLGGVPGNFSATLSMTAWDAQNNCNSKVNWDITHLINHQPTTGTGEAFYFQWVDSGTIKVSVGINTKNENDGETYRVINPKQPNRFFRDSENGQDCQDYVDVDVANNSGNELNWQCNGKKQVQVGANFVNVNSITDGGKNGKIATIASRQFLIGGVQNKNKPATAANTGGAADQTCESENHTGLEYLFCPVVNALDSTINDLNSQIESLLTFKTSGKGSDFGAGNEMKTVWSAFRLIATLLIVLAMMIAVISQTAGWDFIDAYTIRRLLPKLVIAAIFIQISFPVTVWLIDLFNAIGAGVAELIFAPFGGSGHVTLSNLLGHNVGGAQSLGLFALVSAGLLFGGLVMNIFGVAALALTALVALFVGFLVLVLRKILLVVCVIMAPIAIVAWIIPSPGIQKWWKLWHETFFSLLIMFPIIMAAIAVGRVFASIAVTTQGNGTIVNFFIIVLGFFGPFFLLPSIFKLGGRVLQTFTGFTNDKSKGLFDRSRNWLGDQQKSKKTRKEREAQRRMATGDYRRRDRLMGRPATDRFTTGTVPFASKSNRIKAQKIGEQYEAFLAEEMKSEKIKADNVISNLDQDGQKEYRRLMLTGGRGSIKGLDGTTIDVDGSHATEAQRRVVLDNALGFKDYQNVDEYLRTADASRNETMRQEATRFRQANVGELNKSLQHSLVPAKVNETTGQLDVSAGFAFAAGKNPEAIVGMSGYEVQSILANTEGADLEKFLANYAAAASGKDRLALDQGGAEAVKAFLNNDPNQTIGKINGSWVDPKTGITETGKPKIIGSIDMSKAARINPDTRNIINKEINDNGTIVPRQNP